METKEAGEPQHIIVRGTIFRRFVLPVDRRYRVLVGLVILAFAFLTLVVLIDVAIHPSKSRGFDADEILVSEEEPSVAGELSTKTHAPNCKDEGSMPLAGPQDTSAYPTLAPTLNLNVATENLDNSAASGVHFEIIQYASLGPSTVPSGTSTPKPTLDPTIVVPITQAPTGIHISSSPRPSSPPSPRAAPRPTPRPTVASVQRPSPGSLHPTPRATLAYTRRPTSTKPTAIWPTTDSSPRPSTRPTPRSPPPRLTPPPTPRPVLRPTSWPSTRPTNMPLERSSPSPTLRPTFPPTKPPTLRPTPRLSPPPTKSTPRPTLPPTLRPTPRLSPPPTKRPSPRPSPIPTPRTVLSTHDLSFVPGLLTGIENGLLLSAGLTSRIIAESGSPVRYENQFFGTESDVVFHGDPDAAACFEDPRANNNGGWIYVSNAESENGNGGVGAITFDRDGNVLKYDRLLTGTTKNCGGGKTPWETWISCEENGAGRIFQVDPTGQRSSQPITLGSEGGNWESFAYDDRNRNTPRFFVTEDAEGGALQRFTPNPFHINWSQPWDMLHGTGVTEYLFLHPEPETGLSRGTVSWGSDREAARHNAGLYYPYTEGIDVHNGILYVVCKEVKMLFELNLDTNTYTRQSTQQGLFSGEPDQLRRLLLEDGAEYLFFTEDGGAQAGIHGRDLSGLYFTVLESPTYADETTGLSFSPNGLHMYIAYQDNGILFDITRTDGLPFPARSLDVKYHAVNA